jgi:hypothetical protein
MNNFKDFLLSELLDFCRVKKITDKGYGFLRSLYYPGDVFFHFSQIKKEEFLEKLNLMKRGEFFLYFISAVNIEGKRSVRELWYSLDAVPHEHIPAFADTIASHFDMNRTNLFDLLFAFSELRKNGYNNPIFLERVLSSEKILKLPTTILPYLTEEEIEQFKSVLTSKGLRLPQS